MRSCLVVLTLVVLSAIGPARGAQFEEIATGLIPASVGAAWGDYDADGYPDLFVAGYNHPQAAPHGPLLFHNGHDLRFTEVSASLGLPPEAVDSEGAAWADYNNDGRLDVLVASDTAPFLYRGEAAGFVLVTPPAGLISAGPAVGVAWCDYDGDDLLDVFLPTVGECALYHNNGDGTFTDVHAAAGVVTSGSGGAVAASAAWGDYDNDGRPDLLVARAGGPAMLFGNNGDGTFADVSSESGVAAAADTWSVGWADYDNDGWLDCYLGTKVGGHGWLFHNNHDGTFTGVNTSAGMVDIAVGTSLAWGDYDNDGYLDLYVGTWNPTGDAPPFLYHNNGDGTFANAVIGSGLEDHYAHDGAAWADLDRDGRLDLMQANGDHEARLFHNMGSAGNWVRVQAVTSGTGDATEAGQPTREAIGARVDVNLDNDASFPPSTRRTLTRLIDGGSGHWAQNEQVAQFGVGAASLVAVRVSFPDGSVVVHQEVAANQQITVRDVPAGREQIFPDVPLDFWAYPQITATWGAGVVTGYPNGLYRPEVEVTRDQMAVYISRALEGGDEGVHVPTGVTEPTFGDVGAEHWAYRHVEYCAGAGIVTGYPNGEYRPDEVVDRGQMAVYVARAVADPVGDAGVPEVPAGAAPTFSDVTGENDWAWCYRYVESCAGKGIVQGYAGGVYYPEYPVTRDQMAVYVQRAFELPM